MTKNIFKVIYGHGWEPNTPHPYSEDLDPESKKLEKKNLIDLAVQYLLQQNISMECLQRKDLKESTERVKIMLKNLRRNESYKKKRIPALRK